MDAKTFFAVMCVAGLASGCATQSTLRYQAEPLQQPSVDAQLVKALKTVAEEVRSEKQKIVAINAAKAKKITEVPDAQIPELDLPVYVPDWHGPVDTLLEKIAFGITYRFEVRGTPSNGIRPTVRARYVGTPLREVLADIDRQIGDRTVLSFDADQRVITLTYR